MAVLKKPKKVVIPPTPIPDSVNRESATAKKLREKLAARRRKNK